MKSVKNILFVNSLINTNYATARYQPLGIAYIAAFLEKNSYQCDLYDGNIGAHNTLENSYLKCFEKKYDLIGISATSDGFKNAVELAIRIKSKNPEIIIVLGGHHATPLHYKIIEDYDCFDYIVRGEGEYTFYKLVTSINENTISCMNGVTFKRSGKIYIGEDENYINNLNDLPFPSRDKLESIEAYTTYFDKYEKREKLTATIITSRGCVGKCIFCVDQDIYLKKKVKRWRCRSVENVTKELNIICNNIPKPEHIIFFDACFLVDINRAINILENLHSINKNITCSFTARADQIVKHKDYIKTMKNLGCISIEIGIESGSENCLKRFDKGISVAKNQEAVTIMRENDILSQIDFIMFEPYMTLDDLKQNMTFLKNNNLFGHYPPLIYNRIILYPGSKIREKMEKENRTFGSYHSLQYNHIDKKVNNCWIKLLFYMKECSILNECITNIEKQRFFESEKTLSKKINASLQLAKIIPYLYMDKVIEEEERNADGESLNYIELAKRLHFELSKIIV